MARVMPKVESMPTAEMPMPYKPSLKLAAPPARRKLARTAAEMIRMGRKVERIPTEMPLITTGAVPLWAVHARSLVGLYVEEV